MVVLEMNWQHRNRKERTATTARKRKNNHNSKKTQKQPQQQENAKNNHKSKKKRKNNHNSKKKRKNNHNSKKKRKEQPQQQENAKTITTARKPLTLRRACSVYVTESLMTFSKGKGSSSKETRVMITEGGRERGVRRLREEEATTKEEQQQWSSRFYSTYPGTPSKHHVSLHRWGQKYVWRHHDVPNVG